MIALSSHKIFCPGTIAYYLVEPMKKVIFYPRKFPVLLGFELASQSMKHQIYAVTVYQLKHIPKWNILSKNIDGPDGTKWKEVACVI